jgi:hypothetical protein
MPGAGFGSSGVELDFGDFDMEGKELTHGICSSAHG